MAGIFVWCTAATSGRPGTTDKVYRYQYMINERRLSGGTLSVLQTVFLSPCFSVSSHESRKVPGTGKKTTTPDYPRVTHLPELIIDYPLRVFIVSSSCSMGRSAGLPGTMLDQSSVVLIRLLLAVTHLPVYDRHMFRLARACSFRPV